MRIIIIFFLTSFLFAQAPDVEWFRGHGTRTEEHVHEGMQTSDGGYIAIGHGIESSGSDDMLIIKVDKNGYFKWKQDFGTPGKKGAGYCIAEAPDGYIAGGGIYDPVSQRTQRFLAKINFDGHVVWEKFYASSGVGGIRGIDITRDGGIVATGYINTPNTPEFQGYVFIVDEGDGFIMKLDAEGQIQWEKSIDAPQGTKIREIDQGYAVCSCVWNWTQESGDHQDFCLIKTDTAGTTIWRKTYGGEKSDHLYDFDLTEDGGYILAGHTLSYGVSNWDYLLMKIDSNGNEEWFKTFGQPRNYDPRYIHDEAYGVLQIPDGGYVIAGGSGDEYSYSASGHPSGPSGEWKVYLVRTDSQGHILWEGIYPAESVGNNGGEYIVLTSDGGYIVFVDTDTQTPPTPNNFGFLKTAPDAVSSTIHNKSSSLNNYELLQNFPNPFNGSTTIQYALAKKGHVEISIYNLLGQKVKTLVNQTQPAGRYSVQWHEENMVSGLFIYQIKSGSCQNMKKMLLLE